MSETRGATAVRRLVSAVTCGLVVGAAVAVPASAQEQGPSHHPSQHRRVLKAHLTGEKERPTAADPDGRGKAKITLRGDQICFRLSWRDIQAPTAAHIHAGRRDVAGPVVVPLFSVPGGLAAPVDRVGGCADVDRELVRDIRRHPRAYYVNIHNAEYPAGAIRGQLHR